VPGNKKGNANMKFDVVRAWKDTAYRSSLSREELSLLPSNPVGEIELTDADLETVNGTQGAPVRYTETHAPAVISAVRTLICINSSVIGGNCNSFSVEAGCNTSQSDLTIAGIKI
jgi:mersacidin/lichenicidin family type 2 lantibiotic